MRAVIYGILGHSRELLKVSMHHRQFVAFRHERERIRSLLEPYYEEYVSDVSDRGMAASIESACLLYFLAERYQGRQQPACFLDCGSGFSSFCLRLAAGPGTNLRFVTVDGDPEWLERSRKFMSDKGISCDKDLYATADLGTLPEFHPDVIFFDIYHTEDGSRADALDFLRPHLASGSMIVLDDMHKPIYRERVQEWVRGESGRLVDLKYLTRDEHGRFCSVLTSVK
jgi:predicted O-methyltransferase YrrM